MTRRRPPTTVTPTTLVEQRRAAPGQRPVKVTAAARLVELLRVGLDARNVGASLGLTPGEVRAWLRQGTALLIEYRQGYRMWQHFTRTEQELIHLAIDSQLAVADWIGRQEAQLEALARGGLEVTEVVERHDRQGNVTSRVERTRKLPPDAAVLTWRLERRLPEVYGRRTEILIDGIDTSSDDDTRTRLTRRLIEVAERLPLAELPSGNGHDPREETNGHDDR